MSVDGIAMVMVFPQCRMPLDDVDALIEVVGRDVCAVDCERLSREAIDDGQQLNVGRWQMQAKPQSDFVNIPERRVACRRGRRNR